MEEALVSGNNPIPDAHITASSEYNVDYAARFARINTTGGWKGWLASSLEINAPEPRMYLQVCPLLLLLFYTYYYICIIIKEIIIIII